MIKTDFFMTCHDGHEINVFKWTPEGEIKGVFQLVHGSIEHANRYDHFARYLVGEGYVVYADDHRGHGLTAKKHDSLGFFSEKPGGYDLMVEDLKTLNAKITDEYPNKKNMMFGHSMGSFMVRSYIAKHPKTINGAVICGTVDSNAIVSNFGILMANRDIKKHGRKNQSQKLNDLVYGSLNNKIKNPRTGSDFISKDESVVDRYIADPYCGYLATSDYISEMLIGLKDISNKKTFENTPNELPLFIISGEEDPCGGKLAKDVRNVHSKYKASGCVDVSINIYNGARHEILNEKINEKVYNDINKWASNYI
jgi:alpha-beta hydrolase superfamily lysophospholipase